MGIRDAIMMHNMNKRNLENFYKEREEENQKRADALQREREKAELLRREELRRKVEDEASPQAREYWNKRYGVKSGGILIEMDRRNKMMEEFKKQQAEKERLEGEKEKERLRRAEEKAEAFTRRWGGL